VKHGFQRDSAKAFAKKTTPQSFFEKKKADPGKIGFLKRV
jgi:hypothetical protein